ncbi:3D domain-containing protein [Brevibacillus marinus]|uniref:3D domain-containing protein n=1 Tax=Brevibacillus marinus TaxID=2496837 RepID=UPI000F829CA9|nr:3D domain-containing protein [Brevibacillus marinus]
MNGKVIISLVVALAVAVTGFASSGFTYAPVGRDTGKAIYGLQEKREGIKTVKKRLVSTSSFTQVIDKPHELEQNLQQYPKVRVVATGYYAGYESTGKTPSHPQYGITYSGVKVRRGTYSTIAADLRVFPLGTVLYIPGYGYGVVADKGGAVRGNKIDLYFETKQDVYSQWGKRTVDVYVLHRGTGKLTEQMFQALSEEGVAAMARLQNEQ